MLGTSNKSPWIPSNRSLGPTHPPARCPTTPRGPDPLPEPGLCPGTSVEPSGECGLETYIFEYSNRVVYRIWLLYHIHTACVELGGYQPMAYKGYKRVGGIQRRCALFRFSCDLPHQFDSRAGVHKKIKGMAWDRVSGQQLESGAQGKPPILSKHRHVAQSKCIMIAHMPDLQTRASVYIIILVCDNLNPSALEVSSKQYLAIYGCRENVSASLCCISHIISSNHNSHTRNWIRIPHQPPSGQYKKCKGVPSDGQEWLLSAHSKGPLVPRLRPPRLEDLKTTQTSPVFDKFN